MNRDDLIFSGSKLARDLSPEERRQREREKRARQKARGNLDEKPQRPGAPPQETDNQRRNNNPWRDRNNMFGTGDTRTARGQRRRDAMRQRRERQQNAPMPGGTRPPAPAPEPTPERPRRRRLRPKPQRPS